MFRRSFLKLLPFLSIGICQAETEKNNKIDSEDFLLNLPEEKKKLNLFLLKLLHDIGGFRSWHCEQIRKDILKNRQEKIEIWKNKFIVNGIGTSILFTGYHTNKIEEGNWFATHEELWNTIVHSFQTGDPRLIEMNPQKIIWHAPAGLAKK